MISSYSKYVTIFFSVIYVTSAFIFAQSLESRQEILFKQIKIEDGLSQSTSYCIIQDKKGFLWFGTANGLNRYDGYNFTVFTDHRIIWWQKLFKQNIGLFGKRRMPYQQFL